MIWQNFIIIVLGSSVIAAIVSCAFNYFLEQKRKEAERQEKLYGPLRFRLMLMKDNVITREKLREDMRIKFREVSKHPDTKNRGKVLIEHVSQLSREVDGPAITEWWSHANKISDLLENYSGLIREDDWPLVRDFTFGLFLRELVVGKSTYKDTSNLFTDEMIDEGTKKFLNAAQKLQDKILQ